MLTFPNLHAVISVAIYWNACTASGHLTGFRAKCLPLNSTCTVSNNERSFVFVLHTEYKELFAFYSRISNSARSLHRILFLKIPSRHSTASQQFKIPSDGHDYYRQKFDFVSVTTACNVIRQVLSQLSTVDII